jgi:hypothetical protein
MERLKAMPENTDRELTVLDKLLIKDPNPKTATVMAFDMMAAGIDTVTISMEQIPFDTLIVAQPIKNSLPPVNPKVNYNVPYGPTLFIST